MRMVVSAVEAESAASLQKLQESSQDTGNITHEDQAVRVNAVIEEFQKRFNSLPDFVVRAPGRVNIIGEHIDYCSYGVFPMAVEQDILVATKKATDVDVIQLKNSDAIKYPDFSCRAGSIQINSSSPKWNDYFLCGLKAIQEKFNEIPGLLFLVKGTVPPAAGMSSSSALVCAAALATMHALGKDLPREELASMCARCERYVGVQGGGMDQAICLLAEKGAAKLIEFEPKLKAETVLLPKDAVFVVANSCVEINKGNTSHYNTRVVECRLAAQLILKKKGFDWKKAVRLSDLQKVLKLSLAECADVVKACLHEKPYSLEELCDSFNMSKDDFVEWALSEKTKDLTSFELHKRALHVFEEADRVYKFKEACEAGDLSRMGKLMTQSHTSCRDLYDCSHEQLDKIVDICTRTGALGSRLTGAGWGGCSVTLTTASNVAPIIAALESGFYNPRGLSTQGNVFVSSPADRAKVFVQ